MYGLDINFLKDREPRVFEQQPRQRAGFDEGDRRPLILGLVGMLIPLSLVGGYWLWSRQQVAQLQQRNTELDIELAELQSKLQEVSSIQGQIDLVKAENTAFVSIFNQIVPWSALLQDIRNRTPARVQITDLTQTAGTAPATPPAVDPAADPAANPAGTPPVSGGVELSGVACSYDDINDYALVLQRSPLLQAASVKIEQAERQSELLVPEVSGTCPGTPPGEPAFLVDYRITANITDTPASQLIDELDRQGTVGLVTRLRALRETGVLE